MAPNWLKLVLYDGQVVDILSIVHGMIIEIP